MEGLDRSQQRWLRLVRGIQAGVVGGMVMLGFLVLASLLANQGWWQIPNLLGSTFYGNRAFRAGASTATVSGVALHFVITGLIGAAFGLVFGGVQKKGRLFLLGIVAGLAWHYLGQMLFWPRINARVPAYSSEPLLLFSHMLFGACLGPMMAAHVRGEPANSATAATVPPPEEAFESPPLRQD